MAWTQCPSTLETWPHWRPSTGRYYRTCSPSLTVWPLPWCISLWVFYLPPHLEILGLLGQLALCYQDDHNVRKIVQHNLNFFDDKFGGWSGLVRQKAAMYGLPDPLQYMGHPWRSDRWRSQSREVIVNYWDNKLKSDLRTEDGEEKSSLIFVDSASLTTSTPMPIWQQAGLDSISVKATPVSWIYCGVYFTREFMFKMKKAKSPFCVCNNEITENLQHS